MNVPPLPASAEIRAALRRLSVVALGLVGVVGASGAHAATTFPEAEVAVFTDRHCSSCHNDVDKEGGLDLTSLAYAPQDAGNFLTWVKVHDRVQAGEMPPKEKKRPEAADMNTFIQGLASSLIVSEQQFAQAEGRALRRRLNRSEYENALRDLLLAPWLQVKDQLPEDGEAYRFNKVGTALDVSYVHMARYMSAAEYAMRQAMSVEAERPPTTKTRYYARDDTAMTQFTPRVGNGGPDRLKFPVLGVQAQPEVRTKKAPLSVGDADPVGREQEAVGWMSSDYVTGFASNWSTFRAPVAGRYRFKFSGYSLWVGGGGQAYRFANGQDRVGMPGSSEWFRPNFDEVTAGRRYEPITVYAKGGSANRRLGGFDVTPEPTVSELESVWLLANEYIVTDASRFFKSRPTGFKGGFTNPLAQRDGMPAVAFRWMEVEGPLYDESSGGGFRLMFGDLPIKKPEVAAGRGRGRGGVRPAPEVAVLSENPEQDAERLLRPFMARAYRRPVQENDVQGFLALIKERLAAGLNFTNAMIAGYTAVLASPEFVFLQESPGALDDHALATRLALFLWNSEPDLALRGRAARGELRQPGMLLAEAQRMLDDPKSGRMVDAFLDYWLEIRKIEDTTPSTSLYNDYYLDDSLTEAALAETRLYFGEVLRQNLPARNVVDSDFTYVNDRLAIHYGLPDVTGVAMRRVTLPAGSVRGGMMTQASVLKVTANGTTTSPVLRGKWIMERVMGYEMPLPPAAVPAVEPDIRGAVTIRQQLDKHRADESCAACHRKIDPPGFALESFDVMGGWRDRYRATAVDAEPATGFGKNGWPYAFHHALPVDASGQLNDGRAFTDIRDFKQLLLKDEAQIARNVARQLSVFATGSPVRFGDRAKIEQIVERTRASEYGVRSLVLEIVESDLFRNK
jgi:mono/diheme cytochrome c family protein